MSINSSNQNKHAVSHRPEAEPNVQPGFGWMLRSPARVLAFGFGSGLIRPAPGTWGTLLGWALWVLVVSRLPDVGVALALVVCFLYGCLICQRVGNELGRPDHGGMVWDEMVAIWLVLWWVPDAFRVQLLAFGLFRLFDIVKPPPIRFFDARLKNGFGVMWDDLLAAFYTLGVLAVLAYAGILGMLA